MFVIDVSFSMDETNPMQVEQLSGEHRTWHDKLERRLKKGAELGALLSLVWDGQDDLDVRANTGGGDAKLGAEEQCGGCLTSHGAENPREKRAKDPVENIFWISPARKVQGVGSQ